MMHRYLGFFLILFFCFLVVSAFGVFSSTSEIEQNLLTDNNAESGPKVRWEVPIGSPTYATPVIAQGKVLIGTLNDAQ